MTTPAPAPRWRGTDALDEMTRQAGLELQRRNRASAGVIVTDEIATALATPVPRPSPRTARTLAAVLAAGRAAGVTVPPADPAAGELYARLDGLRAWLDAVLADEDRDAQTALELACAELAALCQEAPGWCPGCVGRGTGTVCCICDAPVPAAQRRRPGDPPEFDEHCPGCAAGAPHVHPAGRDPR